MEFVYVASALILSFFMMYRAFVHAKQLAASHALSRVGASLDSPESLLKVSSRQRQVVLDEALRSAKEQFSSAESQQEEERQVIVRLQAGFELELSERQSEVDKRENRISEKFLDLGTTEDRIQAIKQSCDDMAAQRISVGKQVESELLLRCKTNLNELKSEMQEEYENAEKLGISKWMIEHSETLKTESKVFAKGVLESVYARYSPKFIWPKIPFSVDLPSPEIAKRYFSEESELLKFFIENSEATGAEIMTNNDSHSIRISGGAGIDKEVIRLSLEDMVYKNKFSLDYARQTHEKFRKQVDQLTLKMGGNACNVLGLKLAAPEILKLIGSLNFRTSHRQNQYFHSLEVARLAGMIAQEVGVDVQLAKRSGILHDIGKALDFRIEGSHAVISGDYATRFGEAEVVVDTVLAHHDDKVVETPHAYILKAADAMSGARPGARVDMEEGYQKRIDGIAEVVNSFGTLGVVGTNIMHAGREVHVFVDNRKVKEAHVKGLAQDICKKLESDVQFPGQIKVTIVRRIEIVEVA